MSWASWPQGFQRISHPQLKYIYVPDGDTYRQIGEGGGSLALVGNTARPGPGGRQVQFGGGASDGATITRDYPLSFTQGITMLVVFRPTASSTKYTLAAAGSGGGEVLQFATNTSGGIQCDAQALANMWSTGNLGIAAGGVFCAAVTAVNGGRTKGFFRGAQVADAATRAGMSGGVTALHFARRGSSGETMNGGVHFVAMGDYMPDAEVKALTRNPLGLYAAPRRSYFIGEAAAGGTTITGAGNIASAEAFGSATVVPGAVSITPTGIASAEAFGTAQINQTISGAGNIASAEAFGSSTVVPGVVTITGAGDIASAEAFGDATVSSGGSFITGAGNIASGEAFGDALIPGGASYILGAGNIASGEAFGPVPLIPQNYTPTARILEVEGGSRILEVPGGDRVLEVPA